MEASSGYTDDTSETTKYSAFYFGINYKEEDGSHVSGTAYEDNWYLPSVAEMYELGKIYTTINSAISSCGGTTVKEYVDTSSEYEYISSSQYGSDTNRVLTIRFKSSLHIDYEYKYNSSSMLYVLAIREF